MGSNESAVNTLGGGSPKRTIGSSSASGARTSSGSTLDVDFAGDESLLVVLPVGVLATRGLVASVRDEAEAAKPTGVEDDAAPASKGEAGAEKDDAGGEAATAADSSALVVVIEGRGPTRGKSHCMYECGIGQLVPGGGDAFPHKKLTRAGVESIVASPSCNLLGGPSGVDVGAMKSSVQCMIVNKSIGTHDQRCHEESHPRQA